MKLSAQEPGMLVSGATHIALILFGLLALSGPKPFDEFAEATPVDVLSESQFQELTKGDLKEKQVIPNAPRRVDRIAKIEEDKDPGSAKTDVPTPPPPPLRPNVKQAEEDLDTPAPPPVPTPRLARVEPPAAIQPPLRPADPPKPEPKPQAMKPAPAKATSTDEDDDEDEAEIIRQRQKKLEAEKAEQARRAEEARKDETRREEARKQAEREKQDAIRKVAEAQRLEDERRKAQERQKVEEARKLAERRAAEREAAQEREEERKEAEREKAEEIRKAAEAQKMAEARQRQLDEQKKKAAEAARRLAEAKKAEEARKAAEKAESDRLNQAIRNRLLASSGTPASTGATGQQVTRVASAGAPNATGQKLNPSERGELAGLIKEQMERCWSVTTATNPAVKPMVRLQLGPNGAIIAAPVLLNSGDSTFQATADSGMRAIRQCSPYRIPAKFADKYQDWKTITVKLDPSDLL
jgi:colicin import membrane protein